MPIQHRLSRIEQLEQFIRIGVAKPIGHHVKRIARRNELTRWIHAFAIGQRISNREVKVPDRRIRNLLEENSATLNDLGHRVRLLRNLNWRLLVRESLKVIKRSREECRKTAADA